MAINTARRLAMTKAQFGSAPGTGGGGAFGGSMADVVARAKRNPQNVSSHPGMDRMKSNMAAAMSGNRGGTVGIGRPMVGKAPMKSAGGGVQSRYKKRSMSGNMLKAVAGVKRSFR